MSCHQNPSMMNLRDGHLNLAQNGHYNFASTLSGLFLKVRFLAKLRCPHVGYVSAFAEDFLAPCLELLQGFQHVVLIQASL